MKRFVLMILLGMFLVGCDTPDTAQLLPAGAPLPSASETRQSARYYRFSEPFITNLDDKRMDRYIRVKIALKVKKGKYEQVEQRIEEEMPLLKSEIIKYLASQTLEGLRVSKNHNRLIRELRDLLNGLLWSDDEPLIERVCFEEFIVQ